MELKLLNEELGYFINKEGEVYKRIKSRLNKDGYRTITLNKERGGRRGAPRMETGVHRLIAQMFIPNPENKPTVNHINGIKTDNRVENLEWATRKEQTEHLWRIGLRKRKEK